MKTARAWKKSIREKETQSGVRMVNERRQYNDYVHRLRGGQAAECVTVKKSRKKYSSSRRKSPRIDAKECLGLGPKRGVDGGMWVAKKTKTKKKDGTFVVTWVKNKGAVVATSTTTKKKKRRGSPSRPTRTVVSQRFKVLKDEEGNDITLGVAGKEGVTYLVTMNDGTGTAAVKTFRETKSPTNIQNEAKLQKEAAARGISPRVFEVQTSTPKYILMEKLEKRLVDDDRYTKGSTLDVTHQKQLIAIMETLDDLYILHNDGNVLNLMLDDNDNLKLIDFGMAKKFTAKDSNTSNGAITLFMMDLGLKHKDINSGNMVKEYIKQKKRYNI